MASTKYTSSEENLNQIIAVFHEYSHKSEEEDALEFSELKGLISKEAPGFTEHLKKENISVESVFKKADLDRDGHMFFPEFLLVLSLMGIEIHNKYHEDNGPEGPDGPEGHGHTHRHHH
ncbi:protein S100-A8 [Trichosurus vulpecula]|uniref:protein S100-A8 n=1 Tax=Trichosurus vulpecula TaxID=9337 RepID=UPI00186AE332|nr:protein S100-A8 [Trichosurus vulpecula]